MMEIENLKDMLIVTQMLWTEWDWFGENRLRIVGGVAAQPTNFVIRHSLPLYTDCTQVLYMKVGSLERFYQGLSIEFIRVWIERSQPQLHAFKVQVGTQTIQSTVRTAGPRFSALVLV
jgi:hypothetical protein